MNNIIKKGLFLALAVFMSILLFNTYALSAVPAAYNNFMAHHSIYRSIITYFDYAKGAMKGYSFGYKDLAFMVGVDLPLSLFFLWIALRLLSGRREREVKNYVWFLFAINIWRFLSFLSFYLLWLVVDNLVISFRPQWRVPFMDILSIYAISVFFGVYVWLLARTFKTGFFGSLKVFFISHILYCAVAALAVFAIPNNRIASFVDKNMGLKPIVQGYLRDVEKISQGDNVFSLVRIRAYHM